MEYMLLLGMVMVIVLIGYQVLLPKTQKASNTFFDRTSYGISDAGPRCGNGFPDKGETVNSCCIDFGQGAFCKDQ